MKCEKTNYTTVKICISREERERAKAHAKSKGMTFQGLLGQLIKRELQSSEVASGTRN